MDWNTLIASIFTFLATGLGATFLHRKASRIKAGAVADEAVIAAKSAEISAMEQAVGTLKVMQQSIRETLEEHEGVIKKKNGIIEEQEDIIFEMRSEIKRIKYIQGEHERIMKGLQNQHNKEKSLKKFAERLICFERECHLRKPVLGSYRSEDICEVECDFKSKKL